MRSLPPLDVGINPLPDFVCVLAPAALQRASMDYAHARQRLRQAKQAARQAAGEVKAGAAADQRQALEAAREGKAIPAGDAAEQARERAEQAAAEVAAVGQVAREALGAFIDQLVAHRDELNRAAEEAIEETRIRLGPVVEEIEADLLRLHGLRSLRDELSVPGNLTARRPVFEPRQPRRVGQPLQGALKALQDALNEELIREQRREFLTERAS